MTNYANATVAQIRGGFINMEWIVCERLDVRDEIAGRACLVL